MATSAEWVKEFARQADADFWAYEALRGISAVAECHRLLFLQMACEKLCKAHLIGAGAPPAAVQSSHGFVARPLPPLIRQQLILMGGNPRRTTGLMRFTKRLAGEIEVLNPAVDRNAQRPDNCEYPWENGNGDLHSPLDWKFAPSRLLTQRHGATFLKLVRAAIDRLL